MAGIEAITLSIPNDLEQNVNQPTPIPDHQDESPNTLIPLIDLYGFLLNVSLATSVVLSLPFRG